MKGKSNITVSIVGLGYVGLPTAALIASRHIRVYGMDVKAEIVETINQGKIHIIEPALDGLVKYAVRNGFLKAFKQIQKADVFLITVPTPLGEDKKPDITYVEDAVNNIAPVLETRNLVIIESTSPVGTTSKMLDFILSKRPELKDKFYMAYCPERVLPGNVIYELARNKRVVGGINKESTQQVKSFYSLFVKGELYSTNAKTAEMCKLAENAYRDNNIAFANELSIICEEAGVGVWDLISLANKHPRVNILQPGIGVGGHCIAVDPWFVISEFPKETKMMRTAREVNTYKTQWALEKIKNTALKFELKEGRKPKIACLGLAFKPDIDDLRESPALYIVEDLVRAGFEVLPVEPNINSLKQFTLYKLEEAIELSDIIVRLVAHKNFNNIKSKTLDFCKIQ